MTLSRVHVAPSALPLPEPVRRFLGDVDTHLDALIEAGLHERLPHFAPSDYPAVWSVLASLADGPLRGERFLEWGSALGAVAGMASALGFRATGIEIDGELCRVSRTLLARHGLRAEIAEGSFVPDDHEVPGDVHDPETASLQTGWDAYDFLGRDLDEFRVVFAYPWPGSGPMFFDLFEQRAAPGALLVSYHGLDGIQLRRNE